MTSEVEVICVGDSAEIRDLGLSMSRGDKTFLSYSSVKASRDLAQARSQGIVVVRPTVRSKTVRQNPARVSNDSVLGVFRSQVPSVPSSSGSPSTPSFGELEGSLRDLALEVRLLREEIRDLRKKPSVSEGPSVSDLAEAFRVALASLPRGSVSLPSAPTSRSETTEVPTDDVPMFIPSGIVRDSDSNADVRTTVAVTGSVEEAESALRRARRKDPK